MFKVNITDSDQTDGFRFSIDLSSNSFYDDPAIGDQQLLASTNVFTYPARFTNVSSTPVLLDGSLTFGVTVDEADNLGPNDFPTGGMAIAGATATDVTPANADQNNDGVPDVKVIRFTNGQLTLVETAQRVLTSDPETSNLAFTLTYDFRSANNAQTPKTLLPNEVIAFQINGDVDGSLRSGSGSPSKKSKPKKF